MKLLVTGAGGMVGRTLVPQLAKKGFLITAIVRNPKTISFFHPNVTWLVGDIRDSAFVMRSTENINFIVHLAAAKADEESSYETNVIGSKNIIQASEKNNICGIVNLSTISTKFATKGVYADTKNRADALFSKSRIPSITLRASVIYSEKDSGILGTLVRYTNLPLVPIIGDGTQTYRPIHASDVSTAIELVIAGSWDGHETYELGGPDLVSFNEFARIVAEEVNHKKILLVHIPIWVSYLLSSVFKLILKSPPITASNVAASTQHASVEPERFNKHYSFRARNLVEGLSKVRADALQRASEAYVILSYVSGGSVSDQQLELYKKALIFYKLRDSLTPFVLGSLRRIGALDAITRFIRPEGIFRRKLLIATALVECSPASAALLPRQISLLTLSVSLCKSGIRAGAKLIYGVCLACIPGLLKHNA